MSEADDVIESMLLDLDIRTGRALRLPPSKPVADLESWGSRALRLAISVAIIVVGSAIGAGLVLALTA